MKAIIYIESAETKQGEDLLKVFRELIEGLNPSKAEFTVIPPLTKGLPAINDPLGEQMPFYDLKPTVKERLNPIGSLVKHCLHCGAEFAPKTRSSKFCSEKCGANHWYHQNKVTVKDKRKAEPKLKNCKLCGKEFIEGKLNQKYCSKECRVKDNLAKALPTLPQTNICVVCNKPFNPKRPNSKHCSHNCQNRAWRNKANGYPANYMGNARSAKPKAPADDQQSEPNKKISPVKFHNDGESDMKRQKAIKASPDTSQQIPVRIDAKTVIFINKGRDPEEAKANYLLRHKM